MSTLSGFLCSLERPGIELPPELIAELESDPAYGVCCAGAAVYGVERCTCWEPIYSEPRQDPNGEPMGLRSKPCEDCAYRGGSAEMQDPERREDLERWASGAGAFVCHQGMPWVTAWRHPAGRVVAATRDAVGAIHTWDPRRECAQLYKADGTPADYCAGWVARRLKAASR